MKVVAVIAGAVALLLVRGSGASAEDACPDPWANLQGTYKCDGSCSYTASVCNLPEYATGYKRWRFTNGQGASATGVLVVAGSPTISFATTSGWTFNTADTSDCGATIKFTGTPANVTWTRVDTSPRLCGGGSRKKKR